MARPSRSTFGRRPTPIRPHGKFVREFSGPVFGGHVVTVDWVDPKGKLFAVETRTIRVFRSPKDQSLIQFDTTVSTDDGPVALEASNNHHGGVQFRAAQPVADDEKATRFLRPRQVDFNAD